MPSLRYHSGRLVLIPQGDGWFARIKMKGETVELPLSAIQLPLAVAEAEQLYADLRVATMGKPTCQQCTHWAFVEGECSLEFPEGRQTGGRYAAECPVFWLKG